MEKRVRLTDDSINSYGSRIITDGMDIAQYERNPVLLYMHERGRVIGTIKELKREDGQITGVPEFDCASELSRQCKKQWEVGSLRMVSVGIDIMELSEDPKHLESGQTAPTITKSRLNEVSIVDIGANDNAIVMHRDGKQITLGMGSANPLPALNDKPKNKQKEMETKTVALKLGLQETADEGAVLAKITELQSVSAENVQLKKKLEDMELAQITSMVDGAVAENRITSDKKSHFVELGKKIGAESLKTTFDSMSPAARLSKIVKGSGETAPVPKEYKKLSEVPGDELLRLRNDSPDEYCRLYKAEYGVECYL